jgi:cold shock protein
MSSKIPETEWPIVAARRSAGESVAAIAHDYGCSPALVYAVLKKTPPPEKVPAAVKEQPTLAPAATEPGDVGRLDSTAHREEAAIACLEEDPAGEPGSPSAVSTASAEARSGDAPSGQEPKTSPNVPAGEASGAVASGRAKPIALTAYLDDALRSDAEVTISRFREALTVALGTKNAASLEALRQASSELMRIGARTSIIIERLASSADRAHPAGRPKLPGSAVERVPQAAQTMTSGAEPPNEDASSGTVKWFNPEKGFGFVATDNGGDVYVNLRALQTSGLNTLREGQRVRLTTRPGPRGPQAARIELLKIQDI